MADYLIRRRGNSAVLIEHPYYGSLPILFEASPFLILKLLPHTLPNKERVPLTQYLVVKLVPSSPGSVGESIKVMDVHFPVRLTCRKMLLEIKDTVGMLSRYEKKYRPPKRSKY